MFTRTIKFLDSFLNMGIPGFDCLVYYKGRQVLRHSGGYCDLENRIPISGREKYNIYSCSKPITCAAALQLWEQKKISLDDRLSDYIFEFSKMKVKKKGELFDAEKYITIKDLFSMTAGLTYDLHSPALEQARLETGGRCPTVETIKYLASEPLISEPGDQFQYSLCHDVLAAVIEVVSDMRFSEYVKENIFDVLGMENSTFDPKSVCEDELAQQYIYDDTEKRAVICGKQIQDYRLGDGYESGGAGCVSTVDDYMKFLEALRIGNVILKTETIDMMRKTRITSHQHRTFDIENPKLYTYGLGVRVPFKNIKLTEFGWTGAAGSYLSTDRENELCIFLAQHILNSPNALLKNEIGEYIRKDLNLI